MQAPDRRTHCEAEAAVSPATLSTRRKRRSLQASTAIGPSPMCRCPCLCSCACMTRGPPRSCRLHTLWAACVHQTSAYQTVLLSSFWFSSVLWFVACSARPATPRILFIIFLLRLLSPVHSPSVCERCRSTLCMAPVMQGSPTLQHLPVPPSLPGGRCVNHGITTAGPLRNARLHARGLGLGKSTEPRAYCTALGFLQPPAPPNVCWVAVESACGHSP